MSLFNGLPIQDIVIFNQYPMQDIGKILNRSPVPQCHFRSIFKVSWLILGGFSLEIYVEPEPLNTIKHDVNSVTGSNLRKILQLVNKNSIDELSPEDARKIVYQLVPIQEFTWEELDDILEFVCTTQWFFFMGLC